MPSKGSVPHQTIQAFQRVLLAVAMGGCAITIERPANNATIALPSSTSVVVVGNAAFSGLRVTVNGADFSSQMTSTGPSRAQGAFNLPVGLHAITASASVPCWYCAGGTTQSSDTKSFIVVSAATHVCARGGGVPVITLDPALAAIGQRPGRQHIGYQLQNGDGVVIIVDDAPGLLRTQMLVEIDLDPSHGMTRSKMIEAWGFCQSGALVGFVTSGLLGGVGTGAVCSPPSAENDFRSGCTTPDPAMMINQATTSELWLRKQGTFGNWDYAEAIDQSIWPVFGGRRVRFIWYYG